MIPQIDAEIKLSLWLIEVWLPDVRQWRVDRIERLETYAASYVTAMQAALSDGQLIRMRRFVEEGRTPRGGKVRKVRAR